MSLISAGSISLDSTFKSTIAYISLRFRYSLINPAIARLYPSTFANTQPLISSAVSKRTIPAFVSVVAGPVPTSTKQTIVSYGGKRGGRLEVCNQWSSF